MKDTKNMGLNDYFMMLIATFKTTYSPSFKANSVPANFEYITLSPFC